MILTNAELHKIAPSPVNSDRVARDMLDVYRWLVDGGTPPPTVHFD